MRATAILGDSAIAQRIPQRHMAAQAHRFLQKNKAGSLATASPQGVPQITTMYCVFERDFTVYFSTRANGRKYDNMLANPQAAMSFTEDSTMRSVQLRGRVERVNNLPEEQRLLTELIRSRYGEPDWSQPPTRQFVRGSENEIAIFKLVPSELTFATFDRTETGRYTSRFVKIV